METEEASMGDARKEYAKFEELSERIVRHIFTDMDVIITKTQESKDGGYDIVVECNGGQKVYFECKLRSKNLNLRDIAANVIIAYNKGAVAMVVFTNHNYTVQADEHLSIFFKKTVLNIKIIVGEEINRFVKKFNIPVSDNLSKLIKSTRTNRSSASTMLQIDFSKDNVHEQIITPFTKTCNIEDCFLSQTDEKLLSALTILRAGGILAITGLIGVGKRQFVETIAANMGDIFIWVDASLYQTQERVLVAILLDIWGISATNIFEKFTDDHIDNIIEHLSERISNPKTLGILRRLFGDTKICGINDADYNSLICDYIVETLQMHQKTFQYLFVFENLAHTKDESFVLLSYLIKRLSQKKIPCVIIQDTEEFAIQNSVNLQSIFGHMPLFVLMTINVYTTSEAISFIRSEFPEIPMVVAKEIIDRIGTRKINISLFLEYLHNIGISVSDYIRVAEEIQTLQPNYVPTIMNKVLNYYRQHDALVLFDVLFLLCGRVSEQLCIKLNIEVDLLERLIRGGILSYHQGFYACANCIVNTIICEWGHDDSPRLRHLASSILAIWEIEPSMDNPDTKAYLLRYLGKYKQAIKELLPYVDYLKNERQFGMLISACDTVVDLFQLSNNPIEQMKWMIFQLKIMTIKKIILTPKANERLRKLGEYLKKYAYLYPPQYYHLAYDFFTFMIDFKNGHYDTNTGSGLCMKQYFENTINGIETDNFDDWLGSICNRYVLCVKESKGYEAALEAYIRIRKVLPESPRLWCGHISHLACMRLFDAPDEAYGYYEELINAMHETKGLHSLPFHEYVDRAMSKLLAGDLFSAESFARYANNICESNAILDEWGRGLNILGCTLICQGRVAEAKGLFKESMEILKISGYKLFRWRSQLNYIHTALAEGDDLQLIARELKDAYQCFKSLHSAKLNLLLASDSENIEQLRDYHALLAFALYHSKISGQGNDIVLEGFNFGNHLENYQNDLCALINNPSQALPSSTFYRAGMIMMVG